MSKRGQQRSDYISQKFVDSQNMQNQLDNFLSGITADGQSISPFQDFRQILMGEIMSGFTPDPETDDEYLFGADYFFIVGFFVNVNFDDAELYSAFADFYMHRGKRFGEFIKHVPTFPLVDLWTVGPRTYFLQMFIALLLGGCRAEDLYSQSVLKVLYQTYYKQEYKLLKKFPCITWQELKMFSARCGGREENMDVYTLSRILCMAEVYCIDTEPCATVLKMLSESTFSFSEQETADQKKRAENIAIANAERNDATLNKEIDSFINKLPHNVAGNLFLTDKFNSVIETLLLGTRTDPKQWVLGTQNHDEAQAVQYLYWAVKRSGFKCDIPDETLIPLLIPILYLFAELDEITNLFKTITSSMLFDTKSETDSDFFRSVNNLCGTRKFTEPKKTHLIEAVNTATADIKKEEAKEEDEKEKLKAEINELKEKLKTSHSEYDHIREQYELEKTARKEQEAELEERRAEKEELIKLRNFIYDESLQENADIPPKQEIPYEEMKERIANKNILIIGGNDNWLKKMKGLFPKWKFVPASVSPTVSAKIIKTCDKAYFFTDTLGHSNYAKFVNLARANNIDFSYMHGVNPEKNVQQIYEDFKSAES